MQFRVVIPESVKSGQTIRIRCPDGTEANVKVPDGLQAGDSFVFELSVDQLQNPNSLLKSLEQKSTVSKRKGFLERDIASIQDLLLALGVGLIIGFGIIFGFVLGILYATRNVPPETPAAIQ